MKRYLIAFITVSLTPYLTGQIWVPPTLQQQIYFEYDEAGNQIFRGEGMMYMSESNEQTKSSQNTFASNPAASSLIDEKEFWSYVRIYPVPVKDILYIDWNDKANDLISEVGLYEQNTIHWVFQEKKISALDKKMKIDMSKKYMGVYILTFTLKNGQRISKNITKL